LTYGFRGTGLRCAAAVLAAVATGAIAIIGSTVAYGGGGIGTGGGGKGDGVFPLPKGHYTYGDGLGAGRGHQGQDILIDCGKPIVSAQQGRVQMNKFQSAAGNYLVIDGKGKDLDLAYMHMKKPSKLKVGERVAKGEEIGKVGNTGDATACHLHFEMWSNPGWYEGGHPIDPKPSLRRWAKASGDKR
jgi:murein DD-endopeptidase MepM/ murein hydrolase activator NlpD